MDPITAVGLAAGILQFTEVALKAVKLCKEIRDDAQSATRYNSELEDAVRFMDNARETLSKAQSKTGRRITELAKSCSVDALQLVHLLTQIRGAGRSQHVLTTLAKSMKNKRTIEKLENALKAKEQKLNTLLIQDLHTTVQDLQSKILGSRQNDDLDRLIKDVSNMNVQIDSARDDIKQHVTKHSAQTTNAILTLHSTVQGARIDDARSMAHREFMNGLYFAEISDRHEGVQAPHSGTAEWIFDMDAQRIQTDWDNFSAWLRSDASTMYWICGKAAAGKSTLMSHILNDDRTRAGLFEWCQGRPLHLISYFFWKPGSAMQRNVAGMLRSLLYQICLQDEAILHLLTQQQSASKISTSTQVSLLRALRYALQSSKQSCFAFFIDGLDEFEGDHAELVDLLEDLQSDDHVKFCVSSRPETDLKARLRECHQLRMEDYNGPDIEKFVKDKLAPFRDRADKDEPQRQTAQSRRSQSRHGITVNEIDGLAHQITKNASGVFLWTALTVQSVLKGLRAGDDMALIQQRLNSIPKEIETLLLQLLQSIDEVHKPTAAFYLHIMLAFESNLHLLDIESLTAIRDENSLTSYADSNYACEQTIQQIEAQTAGLLTVNRYRSELSGTEFDSMEPSNDIPETKSRLVEEAESDADRPVWVAVLHRVHDNSDRKDNRCTFDLADDRVIRQAASFRKAGPRWIHRSAFDVVKGMDTASVGLLPSESADSLIERSLFGMVNGVLHAPTEMLGSEKYSTYSRLSNILRFLGSNGDVALTTRVVTHLCAAMNLFEEKELASGHLDTFRSLPYSRAMLLYMLFSHHDVGADEPADRLVDSILAEEPSVAMLTHLLCASMAIDGPAYAGWEELSCSTWRMKTISRLLIAISGGLPRHEATDGRHVIWADLTWQTDIASDFSGSHVLASSGNAKAAGIYADSQEDAACLGRIAYIINYIRLARDHHRYQSKTTTNPEAWEQLCTLAVDFELRYDLHLSLERGALRHTNDRNWRPPMFSFNSVTRVTVLARDPIMSWFLQGMDGTKRPHDPPIDTAQSQRSGIRLLFYPRCRCKKWKKAGFMEVNEMFIVQVSADIAIAIAEIWRQFLIEAHDSPACQTRPWHDELRQLMQDAVQEAAGSLSSTQQLLARACVRDRKAFTGLVGLPVSDELLEKASDNSDKLRTPSPSAG